MKQKTNKLTLALLLIYALYMVKLALWPEWGGVWF